MISKKTKIKRLKLLVYMLKNHHKIFKKVKFDLRDWATNNKPNSEPSCLLDGTCGTVACAIGSAMIYPPFNKMGFKAKWGRNRCISDPSSDELLDRGSYFIPEYKGATNWNAVEKFFGISMGVVGRELFMPDGYRSDHPRAITVAKKVQKYIDSIK